MILVTGATGKLGREVLAHLIDRDAIVTGSSRSGSGILRTIDFDEPASISLGDVDALVLVSAGEAEDDVVIARHDAVIAAAERDGVSHVVYTSLVGAGDHLGFALAHRWTERRLRKSTLSWTILRNGLYANLFGALVEWSGHRITSAFGDGVLSAVTREDLAEAAANVAMTAKDHAGLTYELAGIPITALQIADGLHVPLADISLQERRRQLDEAGLKPFQPAMLMSIHTSVKHGFLAETSNDLAHLLGREPTDPLAAVTAAARASASAEAQSVDSRP